MNIELETNDLSKQLILKNIRYAGSSTFECKAFVKSGWLQIDRQFFFGLFYVKEFLNTLQEMNSSLSGKTSLKAGYEDQIISLECGKMGKIVVSGEFIEHSMLSQSCEFSFITDQTVLPSLINQIGALIESHS